MKRVLETRSCGVVEGFYGRPWDDEDRRSILAFLGEVGLGLYVYAPKDDPWHRERWREPYPTERLAALGSLVAFAGEHGVDFCFALSPGLSIRYSDDRDVEAMLEKIDAARRLGVRTFALLLDDIPPELVHAEDRERWPDLGAAHAWFASHLGALCRRGERLVLCPTDYFGLGDSPRLRSLGEGLLRSVPVMWTGPEVVSGKIRRSDAEAFGAVVRGAPFLWDNFPVNDFRPTRLYLGPYEGRDADLASALSGIVVNPMIEAECSKVAIATFAEYVKDPARYEPDAAWERALDRLFPKPGPRDAFEKFARFSMKSALRPDAAPPFDPRMLEAAVDAPTPANTLRAAAFGVECAGLARELERHFEGTRWWREIEAHVFVLKTFAEALKEGAHALLRPESEGHAACNWIGVALRRRAELGDPHLELFMHRARTVLRRRLGLPHPSPETNLRPERGRIAERAVDEFDRETSFWSRAPQRAGDTFIVDLGRPSKASGVELVQAEAKRPEEYARVGVIEVSADGGDEWEEVARLGAPEIEARFPKRIVQRARLRILADHPAGLLIRVFRVLLAI